MAEGDRLGSLNDQLCKIDAGSRMSGLRNAYTSV